MRLVATERLFILACGRPLTPTVSHGHCLLARCCMSTSATFLLLQWQWKCWLYSLRRPAARSVYVGVSLVRPSLTCRGKNLIKCSGRTDRGGVRNFHHIKEYGLVCFCLFHLLSGTLDSGKKILKTQLEYLKHAGTFFHLSVSETRI